MDNGLFPGYVLGVVRLRAVLEDDLKICLSPGNGTKPWVSWVMTQLDQSALSDGSLGVLPT